MDMLTMMVAVKRVKDELAGTDYEQMLQDVKAAVETAKIIDVTDDDDGHVTCTYREGSGD